MQLFNTEAGRKETFEPLGDVVQMYVCGLTPKNDPHLGHARLFAVNDTVRRYLTRIVDLEFLPRIFAVPGRRFHRFVTTGFLPQRFRDEMRLPWRAADQRRFDALLAALGRVVRVLPGPMRRFPFNAFLVDLRWRLRTGRPLV